MDIPNPNDLCRCGHLRMRHDEQYDTGLGFCCGTREPDPNDPTSYATRCACIGFTEVSTDVRTTASQ